MAITYTQNEQTEVKYAGVVLHKYSGSYQIMSDVWGTAQYAVVWDAENNRPTTINTSINDMGTVYDRAEIVVDATPEVIAKVRAYYYQVYLKEAMAMLAQEAKQIRKGDTVKVVSGRSSKGVEGKVVAVIQRSYGMGYRASVENKLAIATSDVMVPVVAKNGKTYMNNADVEWVWSRNCQKQNIAPVDMVEAEAQAEAETKRKMCEFRLETWKAAA